MHHALRHRQSATAHIDDDQQLTRGVHRRPDPRGRALQTREGVIISDLPRFEGAQHRVHLVELELLEVEIAETIGRKGP
jgi:hypothetical protein